MTTSFKMGDYVRAVRPNGEARCGYVTDIDGDDYLVEFMDGTVRVFDGLYLSLVALLEVPTETKCDCGGAATSGTHSSWCSNPRDSAKRQKGFVRKPLTAAS